MNRIITSIIAILSIAGVRAQHPAEVPKLVIHISIDQFRGDYLQYVIPVLGERGFKRLMNEGLVYHQVQYDFPNICLSSAMATIHTGTNPCYHGIVADKKYNFDEKRETPILYDSKFLGNYTSDNYSPLALLSSTVSDELKVASGGQSDVYAIAPNAAGALLAGGRMADAVFWMDDYNGKWATSTYYKNIPWYVDKYNSLEGIGNSSDDYAWSPQVPSNINLFPYAPNTTFKYTFAKNDRDRYLKFKTSPLVNTEVTNLVNKFFEYADFKKRPAPGMLLISYYAGPYKYSGKEESGLEIQDAYYRLDKEIERLLDLIDKHIGLRNALIILNSTGYYDSPKISKDNKPYEEFFPKRCCALLNMYLMAVYGEGQWVQGYYNRQIYLNKKLVEEKKLDLFSIQNKAAEFVIQFSGIQDVYTFGQMVAGNGSGKGEMTKFYNGLHKKSCGDLFLELQPGWRETDEQFPDQSKEIRNNAIISPLIFFGYTVTKGEVHVPVSATSVAPTITHVLRIRPPNASGSLPLPEFLKY